MADRIRGITIEIGGETTKLQDSLKNVNKSLKDTQNQLKDVDKLLKLDPKNMELLAQKQELLGRATEQTADKLKKLKDAQKAMDDAGVDKMSDDYMKVEREIQECEQQQKKFTEAAQKTDEQIVKIGSGFDQVATKAQKAADATKPLSQAAGAGLVAMGGLAVKAAQSADEINTLSKQSGIASDTIQKMQYAADMLDVDFNTAVGAISKLKKGLDKNEKTLSSMGVKVKDTNGQYRDMESIFFDTIKALSGIENEVERDKVAMDLFGKSADELAGYIDDGGQAFRELSAEAEASGRIISQEDLDKANEFNDALDKLKATVGADLLKAGASIGEALLPVLEKVVDFVTRVADAFANLSPEMQTVVMIILALVSCISPLLSLIAKISAALPLLQAAIPAIGTAISTVAGVISGPLVLAIGAVIAAIVIWVKNWDEIKAGFIAFGEIIANAWTIAVNSIKTAINNIKIAFAELKNYVSEKIDAIKEKFNNFMQKVTEIKDKIKETWETIKGILSGELPTPKIKLPHFKITGSFSLNPPSAPDFDVQWYKKAMNDAYILNGATIFGQQGGQLLGGGESGSETIVGTQKLMDMMSEVVGSQNVTVVLQGDASEIFRVVRQENTSFYKSHGYSPFMGA